MADFKKDRDIFCPKELSMDDLDNVTGGTSQGGNLPAHGACVNGSNLEQYVGSNLLVVNKKNSYEWVIARFDQASVRDTVALCSFYGIETNNNESYSFAFQGTVKANGVFVVSDRKVDMYTIV